MDAPQSDVEIQPVIEGLRLLDPLLDLRWEPKAVMTHRGGYDPMGKVIDPVYDGRWEVIRHQSGQKTAGWRPWERLCLVTQPVDLAPGLRTLSADGPYAPVGPWLLDFLRQCDKENRAEMARLSEQIDALNAAHEARVGGTADYGEEADLLARQFHCGTAAGGGVSQFHPNRLPG